MGLGLGWDAMRWMGEEGMGVWMGVGMERDVMERGGKGRGGMGWDGMCAAHLHDQR